MTKLLWLLLVSLFIAGGCKQNESKETNHATEKMLSLKLVKVFKHTGNCKDEEQPCALADIRYFQITDTSGICFNELNTLLVKAGLSCAGVLPDSIEDSDIDPNAIAQTFIDDYKKSAEEFPDLPGQWEASSNMKIIFENDSLICFQTDGYNFSGGAHPNSFSSLISYNKKMCRELQPDDILRTSPELLAGIEKAFRKAREIPQGQTLNEFGFYFENDKFSLPANISFNKDSLLFLYNDYEIGPHVMGPSFFTVAKKDLLPYLLIKY